MVMNMTRYRVYIAGQHPTILPMVIISPDEKDALMIDEKEYRRQIVGAIRHILWSLRERDFQLYCFKETYDARWKEWKRDSIVWAAGRVGWDGSSLRPTGSL